MLSLRLSMQAASAAALSHGDRDPGGRPRRVRRSAATVRAAAAAARGPGRARGDFETRRRGAGPARARRGGRPLARRHCGPAAAVRLLAESRRAAAGTADPRTGFKFKLNHLFSSMFLLGLIV